jgi:hypothetical protein
MAGISRLTKRVHEDNLFFPQKIQFDWICSSKTASRGGFFLCVVNLDADLAPCRLRACGLRFMLPPFFRSIGAMLLEIFSDPRQFNQLGSASLRLAGYPWVIARFECRIRSVDTITRDGAKRVTDGSMPVRFTRCD